MITQPWSHPRAYRGLETGFKKVAELHSLTLHWLAEAGFPDLEAWLDVSRSERSSFSLSESELRSLLLQDRALESCWDDTDPSEFLLRSSNTAWKVHRRVFSTLSRDLQLKKMIQLSVQHGEQRAANEDLRSDLRLLLLLVSRSGPIWHPGSPDVFVVARSMKDYLELRFKETFYPDGQEDLLSVHAHWHWGWLQSSYPGLRIQTQPEQRKVVYSA